MRDPRSVRPLCRPATKKSGSIAKPVRSLVILTMVGGLVATVALPAFAAAGPLDEAKTLQQVAADNAQSLVVASDASASELTRESYSATTQAEIDDEEGEGGRRRRRCSQPRRGRRRGIASAVIDLLRRHHAHGLARQRRGALAAPQLHARAADSGTRATTRVRTCSLPAGTPIYAAAAGVVRVSQESFGGYGVCVSIDHVIDGQQVSTLYGHMTYGTRLVASGQTVVAGQMIGRVGSTGSSTANHLHFEVHINGSVVDPLGLAPRQRRLVPRHATARSPARCGPRVCRRALA